MRYIEAIKIVNLLIKGKQYLVDKRNQIIVNSEYAIDTHNINVPLLAYLRVLLKSLEYEYELDPESDMTYDLYLKLIQIVDDDYSGEQFLNTKLQFSNLEDGSVTVIRDSAWGSIIGDIIEQLDLINLIDTKIAEIPPIDPIRFGIEDDEAIQDRNINMQGFPMRMTNFNYLGMYNSANILAYIGNNNEAGQINIYKEASQLSTTIDPGSVRIGNSIGIGSSLKTTNINSERTHELPNASGVIPISVNGATADTAGNITLTVPTVPTVTPNRVLIGSPTGTITDDSMLTFDPDWNRLNVNTTTVNNNYKLLVAGGALIESGVFAMNEYDSYLQMSGGRCAMHVNGTGMRFRLFNNDATDFPDTSKSFSWYNKGFEHMRLYSDATSLNEFGQPLTWEFRTKINYRLYLPHTAASTGSNKLLTRNNATGEVETNVTQEYADNAAALAAGLAIGSIYRTGDLLKIVH